MTTPTVPDRVDRISRGPVWRALSELYLDAPYRCAVRVAARDLASSPYAMDELRTILFDEIHPVLAPNLLAVAGVWDGFDQDWLAGRIADQHRRPRWLRARGHCQRRHAVLMWRLLAPRIARLRAAPTNTNESGRKD